MAVGYNPRAVTDGLVLALDAGNPKNYNAGISTNWTDKVGGNNGTLVGGTYHTDGPFVGAGYVEFDGTSDYLDIASSTDFAFGTGDFTIEVWVYLKANSVGVIYSNEVANSLFLYLDSGNLVVRNYGTTNLFNLTGPSLNTWTHIALSRSGTDLRLFFNGVQQGGTVTNSTNWTQNGTEIGAFNNGTQSLNGYLSNLRVLKGTALYTSNFTPPTKSLTAITNTVLLTCQGNTISPGTDIVVTTSNKGSGSVGSLSAVTSSGNYYFDNRSASPSTASIQLDFKTVQIGVTQIKLSGGSYALGSTFDLYVNGVLVEDDRSVVSAWGEDTITISSTNISSIKIEGSDGYSLGALKFNGTLVSGTISEIVPNGDISLTKEPFGGAGAVSFDGTGDYLSVADDASLDMGSSNFTIEGWYFPLGNATVSTAIFSKRANSSTVGGVLVYYGSTGLTPSLLVDIGGSWTINIASSVSFVANQWNHFAVTRNGSAFNLYINGVSGVSASNAGSIPDNSSAFVIGAMGADGFGTISSCYISNFRVVKGTALYTSNFTPPAEPLTAVTNTELLTCQGQNIKDASSNAHAISVNGDAKATIVSSSFEFDGSNDYITTNTNANFTLGASEDFALEWWEYWTLTSPTTMHGHVGVFDNGCLHIASYTGNQQFAMHYGTWHYFANAYVVPFKWTHYVVTGQSQNIRFYQNGELKSTNTGTDYTVSGTPGATKYFEVGRSTYVSPGYSKMKVSSVKFYKGKALSTEEVTQNYNATKGRYA